MFNAILITRLFISIAGSLMYNARKTLSQVVKVDKLDIKKMKEEIVIGET